MGKESHLFGRETQGLFDNQHYISTVLSYGAVPMQDEHGRIYLGLGEAITTRIINTIDRVGDKILRVFDDGFLVAVRCRNFEKSLAQIQALGLDNYYGPYERDGKFLGIEIKNPGMFKRGRFLQDIIALHLISSKDEWDSVIDACARHLGLLHALEKTVGEVLPSDFLLTRNEKATSGWAVTLNVPDIVWCHDTMMISGEKMAVDLADILIGLASAMRKGGCATDVVNMAIRRFLNSYAGANDKNGSYAIFRTAQQVENFGLTIHNVARMALWTVPNRMNVMEWARKLVYHVLQ